MIVFLHSRVHTCHKHLFGEVILHILFVYLLWQLLCTSVLYFNVIIIIYLLYILYLFISYFHTCYYNYLLLSLLTLLLSLPYLQYPSIQVKLCTPILLLPEQLKKQNYNSQSLWIHAGSASTAQTHWGISCPACQRGTAASASQVLTSVRF